MATAVQGTPGGIQREIRIYSHSGLFYWWPVCALGFIFALFTWVGGERLATVPFGTKPEVGQQVGELGKRDVLVLPADKKLLRDPKTDNPLEPKLYISGSKNQGVLFCIILLLVIFITNIPLRGLWSVMVISFIIFLASLFAALGWWDIILDYFSLLDIRITMGGYLLMASALLILWLLTFYLYDRQIYMIFTSGQLRVQLEIGGGETAYDTANLVFHKQRSDLFRHYILGFGSGDLIVRPVGSKEDIDLPNVLQVGRRIKEIEEMLRTRQVQQVVAGQ